MYKKCEKKTYEILRSEITFLTDLYLSGALAALLFGGAEPFMQFLKEGVIMGNIHMKLYDIWTSVSEGYVV